MWLITPTGFYSVVRKPHDVLGGNLTIRSRVRADLDALRDHWLPSLGPTEESKQTDYRFRASATQAEVAAAVARMVEAIDYDNFKNEVSRRQGRGRADRYHDVWAALMPLQRSGERGQ